jgi:pSer/pThr/pTyr-binding forkhead associated (FHA) protein
VSCIRCKSPALVEDHYSDEPTKAFAMKRALVQELRAAGVDPQPDEAPPPTGPTTPLTPLQHYLIATILGEPIELSTETPVRIGRGEENELVFPLEQVSRRHAEVRWDGSAYVLIDRSSTNGTFINGSAVRRRRLVDGDRIAVGPFTIVYRSSTGKLKPKLNDADPEDTHRFSFGGLAGELTEMPLLDIGATLERMKKTGELVLLTADGSKGVLYFRDGQVVHAEHGRELGLAAAQSLLKVKAGTFRFASKPLALARATLGGSLTALRSEGSP